MIIEKNAAAASYVASGTAVLFGLSATEFAAFVGAAVAICTFCVNWYYKHKAFQILKGRRKDDCELEE